MVDCCYRGVTVFVCINALCGSVIHILLIVIVLKALQQRPHSATHNILKAAKTTAKGLRRRLNGKNNERLSQFVPHLAVDPSTNSTGHFLEHFF